MTRRTTRRKRKMSWKRCRRMNCYCLACGQFDGNRELAGIKLELTAYVSINTLRANCLNVSHTDRGIMLAIFHTPMATFSWFIDSALIPQAYTRGITPARCFVYSEIDMKKITQQRPINSSRVLHFIADKIVVGLKHAPGLV